MKQLKATFAGMLLCFLPVIADAGQETVIRHAATSEGELKTAAYLGHSINAATGQSSSDLTVTEKIGPLGEITSRMDEMSAWIVENSAYQALPAQKPLFVFLPDAELQSKATGQVDKARIPAGRATFGALYANGVIFLRDEFVLGRDHQILFHELVHHFQWVNGRGNMCKGKREAEAYRLQKDYAEAIGEQPRVPGSLVLIAISTC